MIKRIMKVAKAKQSFIKRTYKAFVKKLKKFYK